MTTREFEDLINQYLDNEISPENLSRLKRAVAGSELMRTRFNQACKLHLAERRALCGKQAAKKRERRAEYAQNGSLDGSAQEDTEPHLISLRELENWERPSRKRAAHGEHAAHARHRHSAVRVESRRKIYWVFPLWMLFVAGIMAYVLLSLPAGGLQQPLNNPDIQGNPGFTLSEQSAGLPQGDILEPGTPAIALATQSRIMAQQPVSEPLAQTSASPRDIGPGAPLTEKPSVAPAVDNITPMIPGALQDIQNTYSMVSSAGSAAVSEQPQHMDEASQRLEKALAELFESDIY